MIDQKVQASLNAMRPSENGDPRTQEEIAYDTGYIDAVESIILALETVGFDSSVLSNAVQTALDAHANNS